MISLCKLYIMSSIFHNSSILNSARVTLHSRVNRGHIGGENFDAANLMKRGLRDC